MSPADESKKRRVPAPRLAVLACPAGAWVGITQAAAGPVTDAALCGTGTTLGVLVLPAVLRAAGKAADKSARPKAAVKKPGKAQ